MTAEPRGPGDRGGQGALAGLRIVDLSQVWAGPLALKLLGDMGADVIKVESGRRTDTARGDPNPQSSSAIYPNDEPGPEPWNRAGLFNDRNRSKRGICLDLTMPEGIATLKRVVAASDVVAESYRFGVLERLGAGYEALRAVKPDIVYVSFSSQGATGPEREYGSYGAILEQTAGIASITGYRDGPPTSSGTFFPDPVVAMLGVGVILAAVRGRDRTGEGSFVDLSQREVTTSIVPEMLMDYAMNGRTRGPQGNRHEVHAPQGVYPAAGEDAWIAITVRSDAEWRALAELIGGAELASDARFATLLGRRRHHDEADALIAAWTREREPRATMEQLAGARRPGRHGASWRHADRGPAAGGARLLGAGDAPGGGPHPAPQPPLQAEPHPRLDPAPRPDARRAHRGGPARRRRPLRVRDRRPRRPRRHAQRAGWCCGGVRGEWGC